MLFVLFVLLMIYLAAASQTIMLHRFASHEQFKFRKAAYEKLAWFTVYLTMGVSFLSPRAYARLHRAHHAYSDQDKDPHSPHNIRNPVRFLWNQYLEYKKRRSPDETDEPRFCKNLPTTFLDRWNDNLLRVPILLIWIAIFYWFAPTWYAWVLFPLVIAISPVHGFIVNNFAHRFGYRNYESDDHSTNFTIFKMDALCLGECFQNNHHHDPSASNFAHFDGEWDPGYYLLRLLEMCKIVEIKRIGPLQELVLSEATVA
ncbi:MAG TPA: fatty acid desaturase [Acidobacteriota bacterium]|jgi:stearoyl-CoA desaturase (delta-9 desaturase)